MQSRRWGKLVGPVPETSREAVRGPPVPASWRNASACSHPSRSSDWPEIPRLSPKPSWSGLRVLMLAATTDPARLIPHRVRSDESAHLQPILTTHKQVHVVRPQTVLQHPHLILLEMLTQQRPIPIAVYNSRFALVLQLAPQLTGACQLVRFS